MRKRLSDIYLGDKSPVYVWLWLEEYDEDLEIEECAASSIGDMPEWLDPELGQGGWESIISPTWTTVESGLGWCFARTWTTWALREGIAPRQPFQLEVHPPRYCRCGGYEYPDEWDVEWTWDIVRIERWPQERVLKAWDRWTRRVKCYDEYARSRMKTFLEKQTTDIKSMYVHTSWYWPSGTYDEMSPPGGVRVKLCSDHRDVDGIAKMS
jgi:hypothetical protein